jgi:hypothetical protein
LRHKEGALACQKPKIALAQAGAVQKDDRRTWRIVQNIAKIIPGLCPVGMFLRGFLRRAFRLAFWGDFSAGCCLSAPER